MKAKRILSAAVAVCLVASGAELTLNTREADAAQLLSTQKSLATTAAVTASSASGTVSGETGSAAKEETVYVLAGADGSVNKIIVSDWLKNPEGLDALTDSTSLSDIENVKGDETFTASGSSTIWAADGNDIYYQGTSDKELPVSLSVSYKLDGKAISAADLAGQSGKVTIRFDYTCNQKQTVTIDGEQETLYTPFVMLTGMVLDNESFKNVEVENGKIVNDGSRTVVIGYAMPGVKEDLDLADSDDVKIPGYVEVTADVTDFELDTTFTYGSNSLFNDITLNSDGDDEDLAGSLQDLADAADQLSDGSSQLYDGLTTLLNKSGELTDGINQLVDGSSQLKTGADSLYDGSAQLSSGLSDLQSGLSTLSGNSQALKDGAETVFNTLLQTAQSQLKQSGVSVETLTIKNYQRALKDAISTMSDTIYDTALSSVTDAVNAQRSYIESQVTAAVEQQVLTAVLASQSIPLSVYNSNATVKAQIDAAVSAQMATSQIQAQIDAATDEQVQTIISENMNSGSVTSSIDENYQSGKEKIEALIAQLDSYNEFYQGLVQYTDGVDSAYDGSTQLSSGAADLNDGASQLADGAADLSDGLQSLKTGADQLIDGISQLQSGAKDLNDGMQEFNEQGIQKLTGALGDNLGSVLSRLKETLNLSKEYKNYSGLADGMDGNVKFIYKTDEIKK